MVKIFHLLWCCNACALVPHCPMMSQSVTDRVSEWVTDRVTDCSKCYSCYSQLKTVEPSIEVCLSDTTGSEDRFKLFVSKLYLSISLPSSRANDLPDFRSPVMIANFGFEVISWYCGGLKEVRKFSVYNSLLTSTQIIYISFHRCIFPEGWWQAPEWISGGSPRQVFYQRQLWP